MSKFCKYATPWGEGWIEEEKGKAVRIYLPGTFSAAPGSQKACSGDMRRILLFLESYFQGGMETPRGLIDVLLRGLGIGEFHRQVLSKVAEIPYGETRSYEEIALSVGRPGSARAVGNALNRNPFPILIPCHRVIRKDGRIGGFGAGEEMKERLLKLERGFLATRLLFSSSK